MLEAALRHPWVSLAALLLVVGVFFSVTNALGITDTNKDEAPRRVPQTTVSNVSATRAWLSPDGTGENCAWFPGVASDYPDPYSFCNYPAP